MKGAEFPGDNVDHAAQLRDVMADAREDHAEIKRLRAELAAMTAERDTLRVLLAALQNVGAN